MNTVKSFWIGWGALCVAGIGSYIAAKREINADRKAKLDEQRERKRQQQAMEYSHDSPSGTGGNQAEFVRFDKAGSPSQEASGDPAPTRHAPATESERILEKSKYESAVPLRARKGDRFS
ncbi:hypothetical protein S7711_04984 [Stachybotrys chartarum IBT 7711]|uniref:Uncharacterized protein n=1 Tax=Stachybotrys chartarum (strain CBS 109288 / IBT 7711) TaxID=1280523 RepID=A0A084ARB8_STACB|nr:hypothetical protein S7711_04984 [Stachybotrys chartarum IBT 7711]KFA47913.1 hypothetical protein S40293_05155 [Stachybotrys chartarum IBT 40293]KFA79870.1 hypothetical protein S40288_03772 [Stachybotrys chartarum IBT 40288]